jgi:curved DNA-binding protein CbpA
MTPDHFRTLGQPRRPWLDPEALRNLFHEKTAQTHPDKAGDPDAFAAVNAAYAVLRDPSTRLRHLLELEHPEVIKNPPPITAALTDLFVRIATLQQAVGAFVEQLSGAGSPLAQALLASERFDLQRDIERQVAALEAAHAKGVERLRGLDAEWPKRKPETVEQAAVLHQELSYLSKWIWQLREALFRLHPGNAAK